MSKDKILGLLFGSAIGDALGAPLEYIGEEVRTLEDVLRISGPEGMTDFLEYKAVDRATHLGVGAVTDDTTMLACTAEAVRKTLLEKRLLSVSETLLGYSRQAFLHWGASQENGAGCLAHIDPAVEWSPALEKFWVKTAAGKGTVASLASGVAPDPETGGYGCGGMMRVAPLGLLPHGAVNDIFKLGKEHSAITHVDPTALLATGVIAKIAHQVYYGLDVERAIASALSRLELEAGSEKCVRYLKTGAIAAQTKPGDRDVMDSLCKGGDKAFMAGPVLAQVIYVLLSAGPMLKSGKDVKSLFNLAVTHSGDTDSVGAIAGSIIGVALGFDALPKDWVEKIQLKDASLSIGSDLSVALEKFNQAARFRTA